MFTYYLLMLDLEIIKYKKNYMIPLEDLYWNSKISRDDFYNNLIYKKYIDLLKYYAYLFPMKNI